MAPSPEANLNVFAFMSDPYEVKRKRKIKSDVGFREKPCATGKMRPPFNDVLKKEFHFGTKWCIINNN